MRPLLKKQAVMRNGIKFGATENADKANGIIVLSKATIF